MTSLHESDKISRKRSHSSDSDSKNYDRNDRYSDDDMLDSEASDSPRYSRRSQHDSYSPRSKDKYIGEDISRNAYYRTRRTSDSNRTHRSSGDRHDDRSSRDNDRSTRERRNDRLIRERSDEQLSRDRYDHKSKWDKHDERSSRDRYDDQSSRESYDDRSSRNQHGDRSSEDSPTSSREYDRREYDDEDSNHGRNTDRYSERSRREQERRDAKYKHRHEDSREDKSKYERDRCDKYDYRKDSSTKDHIDNADWLDDNNAVLDRYNCDLTMKINDTSCTPKTKGLFALLSNGVKSTRGITRGQAGFEVLLTKKQSVEDPYRDHQYKINSTNTSPSMEDLEKERNGEEVFPLQTIRIGFSQEECDKSYLGENVFSYGYDSEGFLCTNGIEYGIEKPFSEGDVVGAYLNLDSNPRMLTYTLNSKVIGRHEIPDNKSNLPVRQQSETDIRHALSSFSDTDTNVTTETDEGKITFYPHILTRNYNFKVNFGVQKEPFFPPLQGYVLINDAPLEHQVKSISPIMRASSTEVILMCGLPSSGKTHWAAEHCRLNPRKRFEVIGSTALMQRMSICGRYRHFSCQSGWDHQNSLIRDSLDELIDTAAHFPNRNYILDQANVYSSIQRRKMKKFSRGQRRTAVVIVPPRKLAQDRRDIKQFTDREHKAISDEALNEMKANFFLPSKLSGHFDRIHYTELSENDIEAEVESFTREGKSFINRKKGIKPNIQNIYGRSQNHNPPLNNNMNISPDLGVMSILSQTPQLAQFLMTNPQLLCQVISDPNSLNTVVQAYNTNPGMFSVQSNGGI